MLRLIILVFISAALAILAFGNSQPVSLVILGSARTPEIPFGLMLIAAVGIGALITLLLYGLIGLRRPPESKYRPIGRQVPYPDSPGNSNFPASGSSSGSSSGPSSAGSPYPPTSPYGRSSAFVSEPVVPQDATPPISPSTPESAQTDAAATEASYVSASASSNASGASATEPASKSLFGLGKAIANIREGQAGKEKKKE